MTSGDFTEANATETVIESFAATADERLRAILDSLVGHLHGFVRDVEPSPAEWRAAIDFLTATGQKCDDARQEFILLSDVLGVSMLTEVINNRTSGTATETTVLGPFHVGESPVRELGADICPDDDSERCVVTGRVGGQGADGAADTPLAGATVDVWQANADGFYDVQQPDLQPAGNLRGLFTTDPAGRFWFRTMVPGPYPIPTDGPVGALLAATRRHRPGARRTNSIKPGVGGWVPRPTISVSKFVSSNGSVATLTPIEVRTDPPVSDSRCTS